MWKSISTNESRQTIRLRLSACLLSYSLAIACQANAQSILPPRPDAIDGGNPLEGLGRPDDPNPSRVGDFPELNTTQAASAADAAPPDPNLSPNLSPDPNSAPAAGIGDTPGAAEALQKAQQLAKEEGTAGTTSTAGAADPDGTQKNSLLDQDTASKAAGKNEASFFTVVADSPIRTTLVDIREGRYEAALKQLKTLYERNPSAIELQYLMAVSSVMLRRNPEAIEHYRRVLDDRLAPLRLKQLAQKGLDKIHPR
jgi:tetratricopeptide (TPR) repeat protein